MGVDDIRSRRAMQVLRRYQSSLRRTALRLADPDPQAGSLGYVRARYTERPGIKRYSQEFHDRA